MRGCVQSRPLYIVLVQNEHGDLPQKKKHELMANLDCRAVKKQNIVETTDYTKRARKLFKRPPQMSKVQNHNDRIN